MAIERNAAGQKLIFAVVDSLTGDLISGDAANITGFFSVDGAASALMGNAPVEIDQTGMAGFYQIPLRALETDGDVCLYKFTSSTANAKIDPVVIYPVVYSDYKADEAPTVEDIVSGVWNAKTSDYIQPDTMGVTQLQIVAVYANTQDIEFKVDQVISTGGAGPWTGGSASAPTVSEIVNGVWDENIGNHSILNTFGNAYITSGGGLVEADLKRINQDQPSVDSLKRIFRTYDIETDVSGATANTVIFNDPSISSIDDFYTGMTVLIHGGTGVGQARQITKYEGAQKRATISPPWGVIPDSGLSDATILAGSHIPGDVWDVKSNEHNLGGSFGAVLNRIAKTYGGIDGIVDGSSTPTVINSSSLGAYVNGAFDHQLCVFISGNLTGEARPILKMEPSQLEFEEPWTAAPSLGSEFLILPQHIHPISEISGAVSDAVWDESKDDHQQIGSFGENAQSTYNNTEEILTTGGPGPWSGGGGGASVSGSAPLDVKIIESEHKVEIS